MRKNILLLLLSIITICLPSISNAEQQYSHISVFSKGTEYNEYEICAASIAKIFGRPVNIMYIKNYNNLLIIKYKRKDDNSVWENKCKVSGNRVVWGSIDGRWRDYPADGYLTYSVKNGILTIEEQFPDGSKAEKQFNKSDFKKQ